jgi:hypothetical protein
MNDPVEMIAWLREQIEGDKAAAGTATPGPWAPDKPWLADVVVSGLLGPVADCAVGTGYRAQSLEDARHIARHDPNEVIADCDAKLALLESHYDYRGVCPRCFDWENKPVQRERFPCEVIRLLAQGYQHRDGYRDEWRPT